MPEKPIKFIE